MRYNYTSTVAILCVVQGLGRWLAIGGHEGEKGIGLAVIGIIVLCPIALFFDWRAATKERRTARILPPEPY